MKDVLKKIEENFNLSGEDSAFDILSGVIILKKSAEYIFSNDWIKIEQHNGKFCNSSSDGKIDLIDISINHSVQKINISFIQVQNSETMSSDKIKLFVNSALDYLINNENIIEEEYNDLKKYQEKIIKTREKYSNYMIYYNFYISYNGETNDNCGEKLRHYVTSLHLHNTNCQVFSRTELLNGLQEIIEISNNPIDVQYNIKSSDALIEYNNDKFKSITMLISADEICKIIDIEQEKNIELNRLFNNNVRGFLEESDINKQIKETIQRFSDSFYYCNNGATIFCDDIIKQSDDEVHIINPRIINGQQSIASMYLYDYNKKTKILAKLITTVREEDKIQMMNLFCMTTNSSNQIKPINLISNSKLIIEIKNYFKEKGIGLSIKEGKLLNNIFVNDTDIDLEELLKLWATIYLERPDLAKNKGRVIKIFYKSELEEKKYKIFKNDKAIAILKDEFYNAYLFTKKVENLMIKLANKEYYTHGKYVIIYMLYKEYGIQSNIDNIDIDCIASRLEGYINEYKKEYELKEKTYSLNNYFKSSKPLIDLGINIKSEMDYIDELSNKIDN